MWQFLKTNLRFFIYLLASGLIIYVYRNYLNFDNLGSTGDFGYILNAKDAFIRNLMLYDSPLSNGYIRYAPTSLSLIMPFVFFLLLLSFIGVQGPSAILLFIFMMNFFTCLSMDDWLRYYSEQKLKIKNNSSFILCVVTLLFTFAPQFSEYYKPGHFLFLIYLAVFPQILKYFDLLLIDFKFKYLLIISLLFFVSALPFGNLGIIAVLFGVLGFYSLVGVFLGLFKILPAIKINVLIFASFILSNFWWLFPVFKNLYNLAELNNQSQATIGSFISFATRNSSIINTFLGQPDNPIPFGVSHNMWFLFNYVEAVYFLILLLIVIYTSKITDIAVRKRIYHIFILGFLAIYITMGPRAIFPTLFNYAYDNILGFQIFRRPASKIYWLYLFSISTLLIPALFSIINSNKYLKKILYVLLSISAFSFVIFYNFSLDLIPFNIPQIYKDIRTLPNIENRGKILLLPDIGGLFPYYDKSVNNLAGIDFISQLSSNTYLIPSSTAWNLMDSHRIQINKLSEAIYSNKEYCELLGDLNIGYIFIRQNLLPTNNSFKQEVRSKQSLNLKSSPYVDMLPNSDPNILEIYKVKDSCFESTFKANNFAIKSKKIASSIYFLHLENVSKDSVLTFLNDNYRNWDLFMVKPGNFKDCTEFYNSSNKHNILCKNNVSFSTFLSSIKSVGLERTGISKNSSDADYFVTWNINGDILKNIPTNYVSKNNDGTVNVELLLWFKPLNYLIIGSLVTLSAFVLFLYFGILYKKDVK